MFRSLREKWDVNGEIIFRIFVIALLCLSVSLLIIALASLFQPSPPGVFDELDAPPVTPLGYLDEEERKSTRMYFYDGPDKKCFIVVDDVQDLLEIDCQ